MTRHTSPYIILLVLFILVLPAKKADAYAPVAHTSGVVPLNKVFAKSTKDAREACYGAELYFRFLWRCEGWWGGRCLRQSLSQPNYVWCGRPGQPEDQQQFFFMSRYDGKRHLDVWRSARYFSNNGTSPPHLTTRTSKWHLRVTGVSGS